MILYGPSYGLGMKVNLQINKYTRKGMEKQKARFSGRNATTHTLADVPTQAAHG